MNTEKLFNSMLRDLWLDLQEPAVGWQLGVLLGCLLVAWLLERALLARMQAARARHAAAPPPAAVRVAMQAIGRVLGPAFAVALVASARPVLGVWQKTNLLRVAIVLLGALAFARTIVYVVSKLSRTASIAAFERVLVILVWVGVGLHLTGYASDVVEFLEAITFAAGRQHVSLWAIVSGGFWMLITVLAGLWAGAALEARLLAADSVDAGLRAVLGRTLRAALVSIAVLVGMSMVGLDITALSVFGGALGVGIGLGLQRLASSYISGFVVLLERKVRIGDTVTIDKYTGVVRQISARFTVVASPGTESLIPNETLLTGVVQNLSTEPTQRQTVTLTVAYQSEVERVLALMLEVARAHPAVLADPAPAAFLRGFGADGFQLELGYFVSEPLARRLPLESELNLAVWRALRDAGVSMPTPRYDVRLLDRH